MNDLLLEEEKFPLSWKSRNLVRFCRRPDYEVHKQCFISAYAFRDRESKFSILKNSDTLPGPDECFSQRFSNGYTLFEKLLGMDIVYPEMKEKDLNEQTRYSTANYYRSHVEEIFYCNSVHPLPPVEGVCIMFFPETDTLTIEYNLLNKSQSSVKVNLRWISLPEKGLDCFGTLRKNGFIFRNTQTEKENYDSYALLSCSDDDLSFRWDGNKFETDFIEREIAPQDRLSITFQVKFGFSEEAVSSFHFLKSSVSDSIKKLENIYSRLPEIPEPFWPFEKLILNAAGTLNSLKCYEEKNGSRISSIHPGKGALGSTYFWDGAFTLLGLDILKEYGTATGMLKLLCGGIDEKGVPSAYYHSDGYAIGYQQPILAWGMNHLNSEKLPEGFLEECYYPIAGYVTHWLSMPEGNEVGCLGWDDTLRWQDKFPIAFTAGESWGEKDWGTQRSELFDAPDTLSHLYLECLALAEMASSLRLADEESAWREKAAVLKKKINEDLFNEKEAFYQDRNKKDGRFSEMNSAAGFLPLYAGIVPEDRGRKICIDFLLNKEAFYSPMPFATLDMRHHAFRSGGNLKSIPGHPDWYIQQGYWIGRVWPHVSYWLLGALHRYGFEKEAEKAAFDILDSMSRSDAIFECYDSLTSYGSGQPEFMWSSAAVLAIAYKLFAGKKGGV